MSVIYLALDDEITSVIEKLRSSDEATVTLVIPKGAAILQSVVNVRLLQKKAAELDKTIGIVTTDPIGKHLIAQAGIPLYQTVNDVPVHPEKVEPVKAPVPEPVSKSKPPESSSESSHVRIKQYSKQEGAAAAEVLSDVEPVPTEPHSSEGHDPDPVSEVVADMPEEAAADTIVGKEFSDSEEDAKPHHHQAKSRVKVAREPFALPRWFNKMLLILIILVILVGVAGAVYLPKATVTLHVPAESFKKAVSLSVDSTATAVAKETVPGVKHDSTANASASAAATGKKEVGDSGKGVIAVQNSWSSQPQALPKGTGFVNAKGLIYRSQADTTVPGATSTISNGQVVIVPGKVDVAVVADQGGDQYNMSSGNFTIQGFTGDKANKITGTVGTAIAGGTTKTLSIVQQSDIDAAKKDATAKAEQAVKDSLKSSLPKDELLVDKAISVSSDVKSTDKNAGDTADTVNVTAEAKANVITVKQKDLETALAQQLQNGLAATKTAVVPSVDQVSWDLSGLNDHSYVLSQDIEGKVITNLDQKAIKKAIIGKQKSSIADNLHNNFDVSSADISVTPAKWPFMPWLPSHITIAVKE